MEMRLNTKARRYDISAIVTVVRRKDLETMGNMVDYYQTVFILIGVILGAEKSVKEGSGVMFLLISTSYAYGYIVLPRNRVRKKWLTFSDTTTA